MSSRPPVLVTAEAADYLRARLACETYVDADTYKAADDALDLARAAWKAVGQAIDVDPPATDPSPLTSHGYRPEHGAPLAWAAEQIEEAATTIRELRNDVGALEAANATLVDLITKFRDSYHRPRRGFLSRMFR